MHVDMAALSCTTRATNRGGDADASSAGGAREGGGRARLSEIQSRSKRLYASAPTTVK